MRYGGAWRPPKKEKASPLSQLASDNGAASACSQDECHTKSERLELEVQVVRINKKNQANL